MTDPMLVWNSKTKEWHVLSEDGQRFELVPQGVDVHFGGGGLKRIRGSRADIDLIQHWHHEALRAEVLAQRLEDMTNSRRVEIAAKQGAYNEIRILEMALRQAVRELDEDRAIQPQSQVHHDMLNALPA